MTEQRQLKNDVDMGHRNISYPLGFLHVNLTFLLSALRIIEDLMHAMAHQGGLPSSCDNDKLNEYFGKYGKITDGVVMMDRQTQRWPV